jgi:hypothetical protein
MTNQHQLRKLILIANSLDQKGLYKEADHIDALVCEASFSAIIGKIKALMSEKNKDKIAEFLVSPYVQNLLDKILPQVKRIDSAQTTGLNKNASIIKKIRQKISNIKNYFAKRKHHIAIIFMLTSLVGTALQADTTKNNAEQQQALQAMSKRLNSAQQALKQTKDELKKREEQLVAALGNMTPERLKETLYNMSPEDREMFLKTQKIDPKDPSLKELDKMLEDMSLKELDDMLEDMKNFELEMASEGYDVADTTR